MFGRFRDMSSGANEWVQCLYAYVAIVTFSGRRARIQICWLILNVTNFIGDGFADTCQQNAYVSSSLTGVSEMLTACQQKSRPEKNETNDC